MVGGRLELEQQHQVGIAAAAPRDAPDHVALAALTGLGVELGVQALHAVEIEVVKPGTGDEFAQHPGPPCQAG